MPTIKPIKSLTSIASEQLAGVKKAKSGSKKKRIVPADRLPRSEQEFAEKYRTKLVLDEVGDPIIPGKNGHLYFDGTRLCWMKLGEIDHLVKSRNLLCDSAEFWSGDNGQDLEVKGIPFEYWEQVMTLAGVKFRRTRKRKK